MWISLQYIYKDRLNSCVALTAQQRFVIIKYKHWKSTKITPMENFEEKVYQCAKLLKPPM